MDDRLPLVRLEEVLGPGLHHLGAEPSQHLPEPNSRPAAGSRSLHRRRCPSLSHRSTTCPCQEDRRKFGRTVGTNRCGASRSRSPPGRQPGRTRPPWVGRSSCATRSGPVLVALPSMPQASRTIAPLSTARGPSYAKAVLAICRPLSASCSPRWSSRRARDSFKRCGFRSESPIQ